MSNLHKGKLELRGIAITPSGDTAALQAAIDGAGRKYLKKYAIVSTHIGWPDGPSKDNLDLHDLIVVPISGRAILVGSMAPRT